MARARKRVIQATHAERALYSLEIGGYILSLYVYVRVQYTHAHIVIASEESRRNLSSADERWEIGEYSTGMYICKVWARLV